MITPIKTIIREGKMLKQSYKKNNIYKKTKILAKGSNPRVPHLVFLLKLGSEDHRATP